MEAFSERASEIPATTLEGVIAKARLVRFWMFMDISTGGVLDEGLTLEESLTWSMLNDLLAMKGTMA